MQAFMRDRRVDPTFIVINGDRKAMESGAAVPRQLPRPAQGPVRLRPAGHRRRGRELLHRRNSASWIKDFVTEGGGLVVIAGRLHAPATWLGTPLADVLPVEVPSVKFPIDDAGRPTEYKPSLSDLGKRSTILSLADDPLESHAGVGEPARASTGTTR